MTSRHLPYLREVLPNGLAVLVYPLSGNQAIGLVLRLHSGNYYESEQGLAHATEHFLFLGSRNFSSERKVSIQLETLGAAHNATTSDRDIELWMHLPQKRLSEGLSLLSDLAFTSTIPQSSLTKERNVVLQEWKRRHDDPYFRFYQHVRQARFSDPNHLYARDESRHLLETFTRDDVVNFYHRFFQPQQMVLGIGGGVDPKEALALTRRFFGPFPSGDPVAEPVLPTDGYAARSIITHEEKFSQANLEMSFPAFGWRQKTRKERFAAYMGLRILGGSLVSRLWRVLREEKGLVYTVGSGLSLMPWLGMTEVSTTCSLDQLPEVLNLIKTEIDHFVAKGPTVSELALEKGYRLGRLATGFEGSLGTARYFVTEEFNQEGILLPPDSIKMVESVTTQEIHRSLKSLFDWSRLQIGIMNDFKQLTPLQFEQMVNKIFNKV